MKRFVAASWLIALAGCGTPATGPSAAPDAPAGIVSALAEGDRDTTQTRAVKRDIKRYFEVATLERVVTVPTITIVPAPAWNEFAFEATVVDDDLDQGRYTFKVTGIYDAVSRKVDLASQEQIDFQEPKSRVRRGN